MKFFLTVLFLVALVALANTSNAIWGEKGKNDYPISTEIVLAYPIRNNYQDVSVNFPKVGFQSKNITAIYFTDYFTNSSGASPFLVSGGCGFTYAKIKLRSQWNMGIHTKVQFWGY